MKTLVGAIATVAIATLADATNAEERGGFVDDARLYSAAQADADWITFGRDYTNQRFVPLDKINRSNVAGLEPSWTYSLGITGSTQTHPIVVDGVMYVTTPGNHVAAINAATGQEIWRYIHVPRKAMPAVSSNRGVAVAYNLVFEATDDARVVALDQATGKVVWDQAIHPFDPSALLAPGKAKPDVQFNLRAAPLVYDGKVIVGSTGFEANRFDDAFVKASIAAGIDVGVAWINANLGRRAFVSALDAKTGTEVWRWYTTKDDGWEGAYASTAPDGTPLNRDIAAEKAVAQLYKNAWAAGSNSTWMTPAVDPGTGLIFVGTGNPAPGDVDLVRPGDNLYSNGVAAIDAKTGTLRWFAQQSPHGQFDATGQAVLVDVPSEGHNVAAVVECGKSGWCFVMDRASGQLLFRSAEVAPHENVYAVPAAAGTRVAPGPGGAVSVSPVSYDPTAGILFVASRHDPSVQTLVPVPNVPGGPKLYMRVSKPVPRNEDTHSSRPEEWWPGVVAGKDFTAAGGRHCCDSGRTCLCGRA
jgi:glucose dehydrogenase